MMVSKGKISVITICYNASNTIEATIVSVLNQTYGNVEYIVVDGASKDDTLEIVNRYVDKIAYVISEPDHGIYDAMNKGIKVATGDWIIFMNAGDCFHDERVIEEFINRANMDSDIVYGSVMKMLSDIHYRYDPYPIEMMDKCMILPHQATFIKTDFQKKHPYDTSFRSSGDYHFFYNAYYKYDAVFQKIDLVVADYDEIGGMSKQQIKTARMEDLRIWGKERNIYAAVRIRLRIAYWAIMTAIDAMLPVACQIKFRNYRLRKQGYTLLEN